MIYQFLYDKKEPFLSGHLHLGGKNARDEIAVSNRYLLKNGECWIPVMGEFHYARVDCRDWKTELLKMKAGGITVISTYVFWIYHEETEGEYQFFGNNDLARFVCTVQECGLGMILRIGPWAHGEVRNGGFPDWLLKKGCELRTDDAVYLGYVRKFYQKIEEQVRPFLFDAGGPIFGIQIENELPHNAPHLLTLKKLAMETGLMAPLYTVTGWNAEFGAEIPENEVLPVFGGYPEAPWEHHTRELPPSVHYFFQPSRNDSGIGNDLTEKKDDGEDVFHMRYELYPFATCELGGGVQVTHHRRPVISSDDIAVLAMVKLGSGNNLPGYYMFHGGTNAVGVHTTFQESKASGYPNDLPVKSYDFQAPIGEYGQIRGQYRKLKLQHLFLKHFGQEFGKMDPYFQYPPVTGIYDDTSFRYSLRTDQNSGYVFVNSHRRRHRLCGRKEVQFEVPSAGRPAVFPEKGMTIPGDACCFFPYHLDLGGIWLDYATAQPLARDDRTWFFFAPDQIRTEYMLEDRKYEIEEPGLESILQIPKPDGSILSIVTLTQHQAEHFYELEDSFYVAQGDLYREDGEIVSYREGNPDLSFYRWEKTGFALHELAAAAETAEVTAIEEKPVIYACGADEVLLSGQGERRMWQILAQRAENETVQDVYLKIDYIGDMAQIYADGVLAADDFNKGITWTVSLKALHRMGDRLELLICEDKDIPVYREGRKERGIALVRLEACPLYAMKTGTND